MTRFGVAVSFTFFVASTLADVNYVNSLSLYDSVAPCVQSAVSEIVSGFASYSTCGNAATDLQSCICSHTDNYISAASLANASALWSCGSSATDDGSSAVTLLSEYCTPSKIITLPSISDKTSSVTVFPTQLAAWSNLGLCAKSIVSDVIGPYTASLCPTDVPNVATCLCEKNNNSAHVSSYIASSIGDWCDSSDDITSAVRVFQGYCGLLKGISSFAPIYNPPGNMTYYIGDIPAFTSQRSCAQIGLGSAVSAIAMQQCPTGPQAVASCMCIKNGISRFASSLISSSVWWKCGTSSPGDITTALSIFSDYCSAASGKIVIKADVTVTQSYASDIPVTATSSGPANTGSSTSTTESDSKTKPTNIGAIVGGVIGGLVVVIGILVFFMIRRRKQKKAQMAGSAVADSGIHGPSSILPSGTPELAGGSVVCHHEAPSGPVSYAHEAPTYNSVTPELESHEISYATKYPEEPYEGIALAELEATPYRGEKP